MLEWLKDIQHFNRIREKHKDYLILFFWGNFSEAAGRALSELKKISEEYPEIPICAIDVGRIKSVHKEYGVGTVPTVLALKDDKVIQVIEGAESAAFYEVRLAGAAPVRYARPAGKKKKARRVTVYSGPGCPACGTLKKYLRLHGVSFREIDISRDQRAAEKLIRRSGQRAIPQTDINGRLVVGFDQSKLNRLLGIQAERR